MPLLALIGSVALFSVASGVEAARPADMTAAGYLLVGVLMSVSLGFLTLAGNHALSSGLADVYASLIVGCAHLVVGLIAMLAVLVRRR